MIQSADDGGDLNMLLMVEIMIKNYIDKNTFQKYQTNSIETNKIKRRCRNTCIILW